MESTPSAAATSFAGLLAALAEPKRTPDWDDEGLADDVATLSYENALRAHARYRPLDPMADLPAVPEVEGEERLEHYELATAMEASATGGSRRVDPQEGPATPKAQAYRLQVELNRKSASVTIRMSQSECEQLHRRAAEAGLTVSAYLRSCTFEAESLRALVKETMAQLKAATREKEANGRRGFRAWLGRVIAPRRAQQSLARA